MVVQLVQTHRALTSLRLVRRFILPWLLLFPLLATGQEFVANTEHVKAALVSRTTHVVPGQILDLAVRLTPEEGWHTYWKNPGDTGKPTSIDWQLPEGFKEGNIQWPVPEWIDYEGLTNFGFHGETWLLVPVAVPFQIPASTNNAIEIGAKVTWLVCREVCIPEKAEFKLVLPIAPYTENPDMYKGEYEADFVRVLRSTPVLREDIAVEYGVGEVFQARINARELPVIENKPQVFIATKGIVSNAQPPELTYSEDHLLINAEVDPYTEEFPEFSSVVLNWGQGESASSLEIPLRYNPDLLITTGSLATNTGAESALRSLTFATLVKIIVFALLGGFILNAMPCVFPVLSLKVMSLVQTGNHSRSERQTHGLAYTAGVISSFLVIAGVLIALRSAGEQIGWGFQLQSPWFVAGLVYLLFVLGMSMSGILEFGGSLQNLGSGLFREHHPVRNSFLTGVLATVVATPCTAPFMGTAMGVALGQSAPVALLIFLVMGLGLALPFLLIAFVPALAALLPEPGSWMARLKEALAFPIYLTAVWLIWVFSHQSGGDAASALLVGLVMLAFAAWAWKVSVSSARPFIYRSLSLITIIFAIVMFRIAVQMVGPEAQSLGNAIDNIDQDADLSEVVFSEQVLQQALEDDRTVFTNMTADWCITCKVNERVALESEKVKEAFAVNEVLYLKGDWTNSDPNITAYLEQFQRNGVPLYVVYKKGARPEVLPQILTPDRVVKAVIQP